ncbi:MAG: FHA domain-containing protein [Pirellulaceae bacterium]
MNAKLVVVGGNIRESEIALDLPAIIGRSREATVKLPHPLVSRRHCEIFETGGRLMVRDLGSMNGTFVGNERVTECVLRSGDLLTVGTVTFRAVYTDRVSPAGEADDADVDDARRTATPHSDDTTYPMDPKQRADAARAEPQTEPRDADQTSPGNTQSESQHLFE